MNIDNEIDKLKKIQTDLGQYKDTSFTAEERLKQKSNIKESILWFCNEFGIYLLAPTLGIYMLTLEDNVLLFLGSLSIIIPIVLVYRKLKKN